jgi:thiamine-phosphate pyrophosphorylase
VRLTIPRLYAILDIDLLAARQLEPLDVLDAWLDCGVRLVQIRAKTLTMGPMLGVAEPAMARVERAGGALFVNDRADVARLAFATGVHLGQTDLPPQRAREILHRDQRIGLSTHNLAQLRAAVDNDASVDYVAIGPVAMTSTKANPDPVVGLAGVRQASMLTKPAGTPLVAIGGITLESAPAIIAAGADSVAVISDLLTADWRKRAALFLEALHGTQGTV